MPGTTRAWYNMFCEMPLVMGAQPLLLLLLLLFDDYIVIDLTDGALMRHPLP